MKNEKFPGPDPSPEKNRRLSEQYSRIFLLMKDAQWRSLAEIAFATGYPEASISAQLRHMRKPKFGSHTINRRHDGGGLYEYQLLVNKDGQPKAEKNKKRMYSILIEFGKEPIVMKYSPNFKAEILTEVIHVKEI